MLNSSVDILCYRSCLKFPKFDDAEWDNEDGAEIAEEQVFDIADEPL